MSKGLFVARQGKGIGRNGNQFDSDIPHMLISLIKDPAHMGVIEFSGGTAFVGSSGAVSDQIETLFTVNHGLSYTPEVLFFLYAVSYNGSTSDSHAGSYSDRALYYSGSAGTITDSLYAKVNQTSFRILHELDNFWPIDYTSDASAYRIRLKYYIISKDSRVAEYNTRGY